MTKKLIFLPAAFFVLLISNLTGQSVTIDFDAGILRDLNGSPVVEGSRAVLVADTSGSGFVGDYLTDSIDLDAFSGTDLSFGSNLGSSDSNFIVGVFTVADFNDGTMAIQDSVNFNIGGASSEGFETGQSLGFYWFPNITGSSITGPVQEYGFYRSDSAPPGAPAEQTGFFIPAEGAAVEIKALDSDLGGNLSSSQLTAVPEPLHYGLLLGICALGLAFYRRRKG